ncbi:MAG: hypothetical protein Q8Q63_14150 [Phaeovulum sp.]|uniref:hypothetical protein n=1 Tax=Phaeovulum sp. TaxID=2934796 RepID=UPI002730EC00|nr:hypothetical protein [Phaeovulum sp.]MDP2062615.1 hypothetical protein [Phaeovulum sp.]MDP3862714.1 hypothetical protein [Phaeovulum sp.]
MEAMQRAILDCVAARDEVVLSGNKESFSYLQFRNGIWLHTSGDTMTQEKEISQASEQEVLSALFWKVRDRTGHYGPDDGAVTWQDVLDYFRNGGY